MQQTTWFCHLQGKWLHAAWLVLGLLMMAALMQPARAAPPATLTYQGYLTSASGTPVNTSVSMTFSLYGAATGGSALWQETQNVAVSNGNYSVTLGAANAIDLTFDVPYYLGVSVGGDAEMTPRQALSSVGYAFNSSAVIGGYVQLGGANVACSSATAGVLRWNGSRFEGCDGTGWTPFAVASCSDGIKNSGETDVDCGGGCTAKCTLGKTCSANSDCASTQCQGGVCTAQCNTASDCAGTDSQCGARTCTANACGFSYVAYGTPTSSQAAGDCKANVCDGNGNIVSVNDNTDVCSFSNGSGACSAGTCSLATCNTGYANCDGLSANGCETDTRTNANNCGACGNICPGGTSCTSGVCL